MTVPRQQSSLPRELARAAEWDCTQLLFRFYYWFDLFRYEEMVALFSPNAVWHRAGKVLRGREEIIAILRERSTTQRVRHVLTNVLVDVMDATNANAVLYLTAYQFDSGQRLTAPPSIRSPSLLLVVTAHLVKTDDNWLIAEQKTTREFEFAS
jgi:SnoaL-like domain